MASRATELLKHEFVVSQFYSGHGSLKIRDNKTKSFLRFIVSNPGLFLRPRFQKEPFLSRNNLSEEEEELVFISKQGCQKSEDTTCLEQVP